MSSMTKASSAAAGHRSLAYQCLRCLHRDIRTKIDAKYRVYDHFMVKHVALDQTPFHCTLCHFVAQKREDLEKHVRGYSLHRAMLRERNVKDSPDMLVNNASPYQITPRDVASLSQEESRRHWEERANKKPDIMQQAVNAALGEDFGREERPCHSQLSR